jgi:hypothetical protein
LVQGGDCGEPSRDGLEVDCQRGCGDGRVTFGSPVGTLHRFKLATIHYSLKEVHLKITDTLYDGD